MLGSPVPMVPMPGAAASALGSYLGFLLFKRARDKEIELEREMSPRAVGLRRRAVSGAPACGSGTSAAPQAKILKTPVFL